jgi:hypothetical protein
MTCRQKEDDSSLYELPICFRFRDGRSSLFAGDEVLECR